MTGGTQPVRKKAAIKIAVDALMTLGLLFLMGYHFWGDTAHEWVGTGMFLLFIAHHILNLGWWGALPKGRYGPARILQAAVDALTLCAVLGLMVSGIILSRQVFAFLPIRGGAAFARVLHMASAYWGFVLMALHLGLHWGMLTDMAGRAVKLRLPGKLSCAAGGLIALYGAAAFIKRALPGYLFLRTQFVFLDFSESKLLFYLDYLAMMGTFIFLSHYAVKLLKKAAERKSS